MGPKKGTKMSLNAFLQDESYGSWADEMEDMPVANSNSMQPPPRAGSSKPFDRPMGGDRFDRGDRFDGPPRGGDRFERGAPSASRDFDDSDRGSRFDRYQSRDRPERSERPERPERPVNPVPDAPPFTAYVGNLAYEVNEDSLSDYFSQLDIANVRLVRDRLDLHKFFAYVEFKDKDSLIQALERNGEDFLGRNVRINVADPPKEDRTQGEWRSGKPLPPLESDRPERPGRSDRRIPSDGRTRDFDRWERKGPLPQTEFERRRSSGVSPGRSSSGSRPLRQQRDDDSQSDRSFDNWRSGAAFEEMRKTSGSNTRSREGSEGASVDGEKKEASRPAERKRLQLKPRTVPLESTPTSTTTSAPAPSIKKSSPFGAAAPVDTAKKLLELEAKMAQKADDHKKELDAKGDKDKTSFGSGFAGRNNNGPGNRPRTKRQPTDNRSRATKESAEEKKEEFSSSKQFDLLRKAEATDDFVPDDDEEDTGAEEKKVVKTTEETPATKDATVENGQDDEDWSVVPKTKRVTNGSK
ncbi:hypothetical protein V1511DRAFT_511167 [Dipodascopsis uninucleata]